VRCFAKCSHQSMPPGALESADAVKCPHKLHVVGCSAIVFFIAFVLDAAFSLSLCGFLIMHGRMVAQVRFPVWCCCSCCM
jgi:hypothetical protein